MTACKNLSLFWCTHKNFFEETRFFTKNTCARILLLWIHFLTCFLDNWNYLWNWTQVRSNC